MATSYLTLRAPAVAEIEVKRSRFLAEIHPVTDEVAARAVVEAARARHWDARHHCSAFILGARGEVERSSDDGEPSGTAGAPMLEVLRGRELTDVCAVVTRWFGGTLLGAGGLVRAYGDAVRAAVAAADVVRRERLAAVEVHLSHAVAAKAESELRGRGVQILGVEHANEVTLRLGLGVVEFDSVSDLLAGLAHHEIELVPVGEVWVERHLGGNELA